MPSVVMVDIFEERADNLEAVAKASDSDFKGLDKTSLRRRVCNNWILGLDADAFCKASSVHAGQECLWWLRSWFITTRVKIHCVCTCTCRVLASTGKSDIDLGCDSFCYETAASATVSLLHGRLYAAPFLLGIKISSLHLSMTYRYLFHALHAGETIYGRGKSSASWALMPTTSAASGSFTAAFSSFMNGNASTSRIV